MPSSDVETAVRVDRTDIRSPVAQALILELNKELAGRYSEPGANHFRLDVEEVAPGRGGFFVASRGGSPVGCGAIRRIEVGVGELKRMFVKLDERGKGIGRALLTTLEAEARALGFQRIVLETGERQPEAIALYRRAGFTSIEPYGEYVGSPCTVCMEKLMG